MASDPYKYFRVEARELLDQLGQGFLDLEKGAGAPELVSRLLRLAHTLKGAARVVKRPEIADHAHAIEDVLASLRATADAVPAERINALLLLHDQMEREFSAWTLPASTPGIEVALRQPEDAFRTVRLDVAEVDLLLAGLAETHSRLGGLETSLALAGRARDLSALLSQQLASPRSAETIRDESRAAGKGIAALAEETSAMLGRLDRDLTSATNQLDRELKQVREVAEQIRLVPVAALFTALERTVRDTARELGKQVAFEGRGGGVRFDARTLASVQGGLVQVVRNAVAHGIESAAERGACGKPSEGRVVLDIVRRTGRIVFRCTDDGRGVDLEAVRRAAQQKGFPPGEVKKLSAEDLLRLLLRGGISTSSTVTAVSGRGVGLDVVRESAEGLGGEAIVLTEPGRGTTVELVVPSSVTSLEAVTVESAGVVASIPLDAVRGAMRVAPEDIVPAGQGASILFDGKMVPFLPLEVVLGGAKGRSRGPRRWTAVLVEGAGRTAAIGVDRLLETTVVLVRPLPDLVPAVPLVAGASLDPRGDPRLILDPDGVATAVHRADGAPVEPTPTAHRVLVIDDSLTTRMLEQSILESAGYEVDVAASGQEALDKARRTQYVLFLVDVEMPGMDGFELIEQARRDPLLQNIPAILVTSRASPDDQRRGLEVGARGYIIKSEFDQAALLETMRRLLE